MRHKKRRGVTGKECHIVLRWAIGSLVESDKRTKVLRGNGGSAPAKPQEEERERGHILGIVCSIFSSGPPWPDSGRHYKVRTPKAVFMKVCETCKAL